MAKIIDFKTKQVLADLPSEVTPRRVSTWKFPVHPLLVHSIYAIASTPHEAMMIGNQTVKRLLVKKAA